MSASLPEQSAMVSKQRPTAQNHRGDLPPTRCVGWAAIVIWSVLSARADAAEISVLTRSYDNARTGAITNETVLSPEAIKSRGIVKTNSLVLGTDDPKIEAQPLYVPGLMMP